MCINLSD